MNYRYLFFYVLFLLISVGLLSAQTLSDPCQIANAQSACSTTEMHIWQLFELIQTRLAQGLPVFKELTDLHTKFSLPFATLFTTLLVAPLSLSISRLGTSLGTAISIALVFIWYLLYAICTLLGQTGAIEPWLAAWMQNIIFAAIGAMIWAYLERDRWCIWLR